MIHARFLVVALVVLIAIPAILYRWLVSVLPARVAGRRAWIATAFGALVTAMVVGRVLLAQPNGSSALYVSASWILWSLAVAALPIGAFRGVVALVARFRRPQPALEAAPPAPQESNANETPDPPALTRRQIVEGIGGAALLTWSGGSLGWGVARGRFDVKMDEVVVRVPGLPKALDGYTIAQISDIHAGALLDERVLARGLELLGLARPDLVVATGDLVDSDARFAPALARALADVPTRDGVYAILGNHDYYGGYERVWNAMVAARVRMLVNEGVPIRAKDGGGFALLGVDDAWAPRRGGAGPDLEAAIRSLPPGDAPRVLLSHQPDTVDRFAGRVALQLSGHTHGGQYNPGFSPANMVMPYVAGRYDVGGTTLYVNRGLGTTGIPARVGAPPEISKIVLVSA